MNPNTVLYIASTLTDIPYLPNGRDENGCDCLGLALLFYQKMGNPIPYDDHVQYEEKRYLCQNIDILDIKAREYFTIYNINDTRTKFLQIKPEAGDLILFRHFRRNVSSHMGIYVTPFYFLHMDETKGSIITRFNYNPFINIKNTKDNWARRIVAFGKVR